MVLPGGFGSGVFDVAGITFRRGLEGPHGDHFSVFVVVVEQRLHAVAPNSTLLAAGGVGNMLLLAVGVDNGGEVLISTLSSYFLPVFDRIDIVTIQSYFGSINSGAFGNASKILGSGAAPQM